MDINTELLQDKPAEQVFVTQYNDVFQRQLVKLEALQMMDHLEGWCSKFKASTLIDLIFAMNPKTVVEIGVFGGKSFIPMARALKHTGSGVIHGIDPWSPHASTQGMEKEDLFYWGNLNHEVILHGLLRKINEYKLGEQISLVRDTSTGASPIFDIDLIHIDGNHSEQDSYSDVCKWVPLVRQGGLIVFDNLDWSTTRKAVKWLDQQCERVTEVKEASIWGIWIKKD